jgi:MFS family permease
MLRSAWSQVRANSLLRNLLQVDAVVPVRPAHEVDAEVERNYKWNFTVNAADGALFFLGRSFMSAGTLVPLFISKLTTAPLALGLAAVITQSAWFLPQLFMANLTQRLPHKKPLVVWLGLFSERLPLVLMAAAPLLALRAPRLALVLFMLALAWHHVGAGVIAPAWQELVERCFPVDRRGFFLGFTSFAGTGTGLLGAGLCTWILVRFAFPLNFFHIFCIAAGCNAFCIFLLALTREPLPAAAPVRRTHSEFWAALSRILRTEHNFRRFLLARMLLAFGDLGLGFVLVAMVQRLNVSDSTAGIYTALMLAGTAISNLSSGWLADHYGHKFSLETAALAGVLAYSLAVWAPGLMWSYVTFALLGYGIGAMVVSGTLVVLEFGDTGERSTYIGLWNTTVGVAAAVAPLLGAGLAALGYGVVFAVGAAFNLLALLALRWWVRDPRNLHAASSAPEASD